jgi:hypothetical protein
MTDKERHIMRLDIELSNRNLNECQPCKEEQFMEWLEKEISDVALCMENIKDKEEYELLLFEKIQSMRIFNKFKQVFEVVK